MEKLIPLLNERHDLEWVLGSSKDNGDYLFVKGDKDNKFYEEQIISKKFGFIKRLVKNGKIDREKGEGDFYYDKLSLIIEPYERLLMLLAIQDKPINFLISILK